MTEERIKVTLAQMFCLAAFFVAVHNAHASTAPAAHGPSHATVGVVARGR
jgi:hypothetical protein